MEKAVEGGQTFISPAIGSTQTGNIPRWLRGAARRGVWVFLELFSVAFSSPGVAVPARLGLTMRGNLESVCKLANPPTRHEGLPFCVVREMFSL